MKKLSPQQKARNTRRAARLNARRLVSKEKMLIRRIYGEYIPSIDRRPTYKRKHHRISLPEVFSLVENYDDALTVIEELRQFGLGKRRNLHVDFCPLRKVGLAGALLLVAELDRWRTIEGVRLRAIDHEGWQPNIRRLMDEMGLFEILHARRAVPLELAGPGATRFIKFRSARRALGLEAQSLQLAIEQITGPMPKKQSLFRGLTEAMTNVANHAYPAGAPYKTAPIIGKWWMAGSFDETTKRLTVVFFDQGIGIPYTLPRTHTREKIDGLLKRWNLVDDDASRIRCAMELGRSRTQADHRGGGLFRDIKKHTENVHLGKLRVLSGFGEYIYEIRDGTGVEELLTHRQDIGGTLIQWEATLDDGAK